MADQIDIDVNVNMSNTDDVDELTEKLSNATVEVERLEDALAEAELNGDDIEADIIADELAEATAEAESLQTQLDEINNTTLAPETDNSGIDETNEKLDETNEKMQEAESSSSSLGTAIAGIAGVMGVDQMITKADNIRTSYNQLELTFKGTGVSLDTLKNKSKELSNETGRSGTQVRDYFNQMGIAGITNVDLLSSSFSNMAGRAYQTGTSIEGMESSVQKMVMTGNAGAKLLSGLGISTTELGKAMGVSGDEASKAFKELDQTKRLEVLSKAMGNGKEANDMYKNSYRGLKEQASIAMGGLMSSVGEGVLPIINPMIHSATGFVKNFTTAFKGLPGPVKSVIGGMAGFLAIGTAVVGTLGVVGQVSSGVVGGLKSLKDGYDGARKAMSTTRDMINAVRNAESISEGIKAAYAIATGAEATAEAGNTAAKSAGIGPTIALAFAEHSLLLPILLIIGAVIAVIAVMWYLYNTNETVRNGINWLIAQIQAFINSLMPIVQAIISFVTQGIQNMGKLPGAIWNIFLRVISYVTSWASNFVQHGIRAATNFINNVGSALSGIGSKIQSALSGVFNFITKPFQDAYNFVYNNTIKPLEDAWNFLTGGFGDFEGYGDFGGYSGGDTLNNTLATIATSSSASSMTVNNNFNGIVEESAADYIVGAVNDRLRREKLLKGG